LSWALKEDLDFNGKCRVRIGEEPREIFFGAGNG